MNEWVTEWVYYWHNGMGELIAQAMGVLLTEGYR